MGRACCLSANPAGVDFKCLKSAAGESTWRRAVSIYHEKSQNICMRGQDLKVNMTEPQDTTGGRQGVIEL